MARTIVAPTPPSRSVAPARPSAPARAPLPGAFRLEKMPAHLRRWRWLGVALVAIPPLIIYLLTLEPSVYFIDSGIFLATVADFGVGYSPGFPLYIILNKGWTLLTGLFGAPFPQSANYFAGLAAAAMAAFIFLTAYQLLMARAISPNESAEEEIGPDRHDGAPTLAGKRNGRRAPRAPRADATIKATAKKRASKQPWRFAWIEPSRQPVAFAGALMAGWLTAFAYTIWSQAINAEVFTLQGMFAAIMLYCIVRLWQTGDVAKQPTRQQWRIIMALIAAFGFAWAVHYVSVGLVPFALYMMWRHRVLLTNRKLVLQAASVFLLCGALPYAYEPFRSAMWPVTDWGHVATPQNLLLGLTGANWTTNGNNFRILNPPAFISDLGYWLHFTQYQFFGPTILLVLGGWFCLWFWRRPLFTQLLIFYIGAVLIAVTYVTNNGESYFIPAHITLALMAALGLVRGEQALADFLRGKNVLWYARAGSLSLVAIVALAFPAITVANNYPYLDRHTNYVERDYGLNAFHAVPRNAIFLVAGDNMNASVLFLQVAMHVRPDLIVIPETLVHFQWWRQSFRRRHPGFYLPEIPLSADDTAWMTQLMTGMLRHNPGRDIYMITLDGKNIPTGYVAVPAGIGFRVVPASDKAAQVVQRSDWNFSRLSLHQAAHETKDLQHMYNFSWREVQLAYVQAFQDLGNVDFGQKQYALAAQDYGRGLTFYPSDPQLQLARGASLALAGQSQAALALLPAADQANLSVNPTASQIAAAFAPEFDQVATCYYQASCYTTMDKGMNQEVALRDSRQWFAMAYTADPRDLNALIGLGAVLAQENQPQLALTYLNEGLASAPQGMTAQSADAVSYAKLYFNRYQVDGTLGQKKAAQADLALALRLDPSLSSLLQQQTGSGG